MLLASAPFTAMAQGQAGIKAENLDKSVRPADDLSRFSALIPAWPCAIAVKGADARSIIGKSDLIRIVIYLINNNLPQPLRRRGVQETGLLTVVNK